MAKPKRPEFPPLEPNREKYVKTGLVHVWLHVKSYDARFYEMEPESWYPNYPGDTVHVRFSAYYPSFYTNTPDPTEKPKYHVSVWGADDHGMEFFSDDREEALWRYEGIGDGITREGLEAVEFIYC